MTGQALDLVMGNAATVSRIALRSHLPARSHRRRVSWLTPIARAASPSSNPSSRAILPKPCISSRGTTGTLYWRFEDWTIIEALYFCVVTLTTVGYGDLHPTTAGTQIFTIV